LPSHEKRLFITDVKQTIDSRAGAIMRLSPDKIDYIAELILETIEGTPSLHIQTNSDLVYRVIADTIYDNIKAEEELDEQVNELINQHSGEVNAMEMDVGSLRNSMKRELAKKQGFIL